MIKNVFYTTSFIFLAIILGSIAGATMPVADTLSGLVDYLILVLVFLVFVDTPLEKVLSVVKQPALLAIMWATNFIVLPLLGFGLTKVFLFDQPLVAIGLVVYFMSPCTDWFLGFTRMAKGNTGLGSVLLPINMLTQLLLYPFYLQWFGQHAVDNLSAQAIADTLINWFIVPVAAAVVVRVLAQKFYNPLLTFLGNATTWVIVALVFSIFAVNVHEIVNNYRVFGIVLLTVVAFFAISTLFTEIVAKKCRFSHENHALYSITTTARNAPLMLGLTMSAIPDQPMVYTALIIGMLIEFPYLAILALRFSAKSTTKATADTHATEHHAQPSS